MIYRYRRYFEVKNIDIVSILKRQYRPITSRNNEQEARKQR